jgi:3-oxoacyl-[acyl-carrier-protein] synthase II
LTTRIVVTGTGVISPIGAGIEEFENALFAGKSGIGPRTLFAETVPVGNAGEISNFTPQQWLGNKGLRVLDRSARLVCVASHMALKASGLTQPDGDEGDPNLGLVLGTMFGSVHSITAFDWSGLMDGPTLVNPMEFPNTVINSPAGQAAIKHKLRGVNSTISAGLVSGLYAMHYAMEFLRFGRATALMAGGVEELCEESYLSFSKAGWSSPTGRPAPFAPDRDGSVLGEGSALWMLETEEGARKRGVHPRLEVCGFGSSHDAHDINSYDPRGKGAASAIRAALGAADITPESIACIVASAGGSRAGDAMENHALKEVFGGRLPQIPVGAPKAAFGECLGATGALLALSAGAALLRQAAPPTAGHRGEANGLRLSHEAQPFSGDYALVDCFGCDGNNAALVLKRI